MDLSPFSVRKIFEDVQIGWIVKPFDGDRPRAVEVVAEPKGNEPRLQWHATDAKPALSLCMIARDSARTIEAALTSIRPWVDEMVVVDTGSVDNTVEIAKRCGARVFHFPWVDDFSAARNESIRHARGEWIFWMDTDDTMDADNGPKLRALLDSIDPDANVAFVAGVHCPGPSEDGMPDVTVVDHVKVLRNLPELRFEGRIHEQVLCALRRAGAEIRWTDIFVVHSGAEHTPEARRRKHERDLRILEQVLREQPEHPFVLFNLGMTYADMGQYQKALDALSRSILVSPSYDSQVRKAYALVVGMLIELGRLDAAREVCAKGRSVYPKDVELLFRKGIVEHRLGQPDQAVAAYEELLASDEGRYFSSMDSGIRGHKTHHNLALVYQDMGRLADAEVQWRRAVQLAPMFRQAWRSLGSCLMDQNKHSAVESLADELTGNERLRREGLLLKVRLAEAKGELGQAKHYLEDNILRAEPDDADALDTLSRILFNQADYAAAHRWLLRLTSVDPENAAAHQNLGTTYLQTGDLLAAERCYRRSLELRPDSPATLLRLGHALRGLGRNAEAMEAWRRARELAPQDAAIQELIESVPP